MRWSPTAGVWARREAVLVSCLAGAAALAGLAGLLGLPWLGVAGAVVAAVGPLARLVIAVSRTRLEGRRERREADRRLRVPVAPVVRIDPTLVGVDAAAQTILPGGEVPAYVGRVTDTPLREALGAALDASGRWLVVVVGRPKVGKSRTLFEALRGCAQAEELEFVAPVNGEALRLLLTPGQTLRLRARPAVLWLDDIETFLNQGVALDTLREWHASGPCRIVAATYGGKGNERIAGSTVGGLAAIASAVLAHAREIPLRPTTPDELAALGSRLPAREMDAIHRHGLAAYLVAGPALERKLTSGRHAPGDEPCPEGVAVAYAAVDWARCGRTDPISHKLLRELWVSRLPPDIPATDDSFDTGLKWALRPIAATIALVQRVGSYQAYDYVARLVRQRHATEPPPDSAWSAALDTATDAQAETVGEAAYAWSRLHDAAAAMRRARRSSSPEIAARAGYNLGVMLGELGRTDEAVSVYEQVVERYSDDTAPELRLQVARALVNLGVVLGELGRPADELAAYEQVVERYSDDPTPELRERVAGALVNQGVRLGELRRPADELAAYEQVVERYSDDTAPELRVQVAGALVNLGVVLGELGRPADELAAYEQVVERYSDDTAPELRERVAGALVNQGVRLGERGRSDEAVSVYEQVVERYSDDPTPELRVQVAGALVNLGVVLGELGRPADELAAYEQVVERYSDEPTPPVREAVARAAKKLAEARDEAE